MLSIDRLRLRLPPGYEHRAAEIARRVGRRLGDLDTAAMRSAGTLSLPPVRISTGASDGEAADSIVRAIAQGLRKRG